MLCVRPQPVIRRLGLCVLDNMDTAMHLTSRPASPRPLLRARLVMLASAAALLAAGCLPAQAAETLGEVRKIDVPTAKITLKHGEIKNLGIPPMTMTYRVKDKAMLDGVHVGDKVRFTVEKIDSQYVVTTLAPAN